MPSKNKKRRSSKSRHDHHRLVGREEIKLAALFTWLNLMGGLASILFSIRGKFLWAGGAILFSIVCDFFDGRAARKVNKATVFGTESDSMADLISFGVAPIILGFMQYSTIFAIVAYGLSLTAGAFRLARYNVLHSLPDFIGMPITVNAVVIVAMMGIGVPVVYWPYIYIASAILMAGPWKVKHL